MNISFENKVAVITGASKGIGYACAELFGELGASVAICARNEEQIKKAASQLSAKGIRVYGESCDVSDPEALNVFAQNVMREFGTIDIWISNAAVMPLYSIIDTPDTVWNETIGININSVFTGAKIAFHAMRDHGGVILIASSFAAAFPSVGAGAYATTKTAAHSMIRTLSAEMAPYGIRVNGYMPGVVDTDINKERIEQDGDSLKQAIALQDFGHVEDIAYACAFLASDYARYITGTCLEIHGGKMVVQNPQKAWEEAKSR